MICSVFSFPYKRLLKVGGILFTLQLLVVVIGCNTTEEAKRQTKPENAFAIYETANPESCGEGLITKLPVFNPKTNEQDFVWVRKIPLLQAHSVEDIQLVKDRAGQTCIRVILARSGRMDWMQVQAEKEGQYVAIAMEGKYLFPWRIPASQGSQKPSIIIPSPLNEEQNNKFFQ